MSNCPNASVAKQRLSELGIEHLYSLRGTHDSERETRTGTAQDLGARSNFTGNLFLDSNVTPELFEDVLVVALSAPTDTLIRAYLVCVPIDSAMPHEIRQVVATSLDATTARIAAGRRWKESLETICEFLRVRIQERDYTVQEGLVEPFGPAICIASKDCT